MPSLRIASLAVLCTLFFVVTGVSSAAADPDASPSASPSPTPGTPPPSSPSPTPGTPTPSSDTPPPTETFRPGGVPAPPNATPQAAGVFLPWVSCKITSDPERLAKIYLARDPRNNEHFQATLKCGRHDPRGFGLRHLSDRTKQGRSHEQEFRLMAKGTDMSWEEVADLAINKATEEKAVQQANGKWCYLGRLERYDIATGQYVGSFGVVAIIDPRFDSIVTVYPGTQCQPAA